MTNPTDATVSGSSGTTALRFRVHALSNLEDGNKTQPLDISVKVADEVTQLNLLQFLLHRHINTR